MVLSQGKGRGGPRSRGSRRAAQPTLGFRSPLCHPNPAPSQTHTLTSTAFAAYLTKNKWPAAFWQLKQTPSSRPFGATLNSQPSSHRLDLPWLWRPQMQENALGCKSGNTHTHSSFILATNSFTEQMFIKQLLWGRPHWRQWVHMEVTEWKCRPCP